MDYVYTACKKTTDTKEADILSLSRNSFTSIDATKVVYYTLTDLYVRRFDLLTYSVYQTNQYDKFILWFNNVASIYQLYEGKTIKFPDLNDLRQINISAWYM